MRRKILKATDLTGVIDEKRHTNLYHINLNACRRSGGARIGHGGLWSPLTLGLKTFSLETFRIFPRISIRRGFSLLNLGF